MYLGESLRIWRRQWILTAVLLIVALAGIATALVKLPRTYQSESSVVLLASRSAARPNGGNPYLTFSPSLTLTADVLSRELMAPGIIQDLAARGFRDAYTVALAPYTTPTTGSVLLVTVTGNDKKAVEGGLHAVTGEISSELSGLQTHVARRNRIHAATISITPQATLSSSKTARSVIPITALGLLLALGIPVIVDGRASRRRIRDGAVLAEKIPRPAEQMSLGSLRD